VKRADAIEDVFARDIVRIDWPKTGRRETAARDDNPTRPTDDPEGQIVIACDYQTTRPTWRCCTP
jgi:hypothetical protein